MTVRIKHVYEDSSPGDGTRLLVERYWPRGVPRGEEPGLWRSDLAPSPELIAWFGRKADRWEEFQRRYRAELMHPDLSASLAALRARAALGTLTLVCATRDREHSSARVLAQVVDPEGASSHLRPIPAKAPSRLSHVSFRALFDWTWLLIGLFAPILMLVPFLIMLSFGRAGVVAVGLGFGFLCGAVLVRSMLRDWRTGKILGLERHDEGREPLWLGLKDAALTLSGIGAGVGFLGLGAALAVLLSRFHFP